MRLSRLLRIAGVESLEVSGDADVSAVTVDSRAVQPGGCFVAVVGPDADGHDYIGQAVEAGASAVVCQRPADLPPSVALVRVGDSASTAAHLAQAMAGWPARKLTLLGVTGTKGKTTVSYLTRHILQREGRSVGLIGTIRYEYPGASLPAPNTTPGSVALAELMGQMVQAGASHAVMEVSSHALDQRRTAGLDFAAAAFTNLTGDHLDYHGTMEAYLAAKRRLFEGLSPEATAVLNDHEDASKAMASATGANVLSYGVDGVEADLHARITDADAAGTRFVMTRDGESVEVRTNLIGIYNVTNCLAAAGMCLSVGVALEGIAHALREAIHVPGRFQRVESSAPFEVIVDYAHTDDALDSVLRALRPLAAGRLIVVFGCGGDRDRTKRPRMAAAAARWADRIIVTQDNPRTEDPRRIVDDILAGFDAAGRAKLHIDNDRRAAIGEAIDMARPGDLVVLAGKGHENCQVIGSGKFHFDDAEVAAEMLRERCGAELAEGRQP